MTTSAVQHLPMCATQRIWTPAGGGDVRCTCSADVTQGGNAHGSGATDDRPFSSLNQGHRGYCSDSGRAGIDVRFVDWADRWLESLERKPSTVGSYRSTIAHAKRIFGSACLRELGIEEIARFNAELRDRGCSSSTRAKHLRVLGACLQAAVSYRYAESNPVRELPSAQRPRPERKEAAYFENAELPRLFEVLCGEPYRTLCLVALKTGMRQGELIGLRWRDVDLDDAVVRVRASYTGGTLTTPKNRERRDVDLISDVVELLAQRRRERRQCSDDDLVFHDGCGRFVSPTLLLKRQLYPSMAAAGVPRVGPTQRERRTSTASDTPSRNARWKVVRRSLGSPATWGTRR